MASFMKDFVFGDRSSKRMHGKRATKHSKHSKNGKNHKYKKNKHTKAVKHRKHTNRPSSAGNIRPNCQKVSNHKHNEKWIGDKNHEIDDTNNTLQSKYVILNEIGRGSSGIVKLCKIRPNWKTQANFELEYKSSDEIGDSKKSSKNKRKHNHQVTYRAVKIVDKRKLNEKQFKDMVNEISILKTLSKAKNQHAHIMRMHEVYESKNAFHIITELLSKETLFNVLFENTRSFDERWLSVIFYQIFDAVRHLHSLGIVHRDLKPENVVISKNNDSIVKIIDFGLSGVLSSENDYSLTRMCGTPYYVAPELLNPKIKKYNEKVDLWSLGVMLFAAFSGTLPFDCKPDEKLIKLYQSIVRGRYEFKSAIWSTVSDNGKDLIANLLIGDPSSRYSAIEALKHPWFESQLSPYFDN